MSHKRFFCCCCGRRNALHFILYMTPPPPPPLPSYIWAGFVDVPLTSFCAIRKKTFYPTTWAHQDTRPQRCSSLKYSKSSDNSHFVTMLMRCHRNLTLLCISQSTVTLVSLCYPLKMQNLLMALLEVLLYFVFTCK